MKKFAIVTIAAALAVGVSAFSPTKKLQTYYYYNGTGYSQFTGTPCPEGTQQNCVKNQPGVGLVQVLKSQNTNDPLKYNTTP